MDAVLGTGQWKDVVGAAPRAVGLRGARRAHGVPGGAGRGRHAARAEHAAPHRVPQDLRGLRSPLHLLHHSAPAWRPEEPLGQSRSSRRRASSRSSACAVEPDRQDTTGWHRPAGPARLADLLEALDTVEGLSWIRVHTYPRLWSDRLIETWAREARRALRGHALQHIAQDMLRRMGRAMTEKQTRELVSRIKQGIPRVAFRTNFIVGFPAKTDEHYEVLERYRGRTSTTSSCSGTSASRDAVVRHDAARPDQPAPFPHMRLLAKQQHLSRERLSRRIGEVTTVMVDGLTRARRPVGRAHDGFGLEVDGGVVVEGDNLTWAAGPCVTRRRRLRSVRQARTLGRPALNILG